MMVLVRNVLVAILLGSSGGSKMKDSRNSSNCEHIPGPLLCLTESLQLTVSEHSLAIQTFACISIFARMTTERGYCARRPTPLDRANTSACLSTSWRSSGSAPVSTCAGDDVEDMSWSCGRTSSSAPLSVCHSLPIEDVCVAQWKAVFLTRAQRWSFSSAHSLHYAHKTPVDLWRASVTTSSTTRKSSLEGRMPQTKPNSKLTPQQTDPRR